MEAIYIWLLALLLINVSFSNYVNVTLYNPNSTVIYNPIVEYDGNAYYLPNIDEGEFYSVYLIPDKTFTLKVVYEWIECNETYCPVLPNRVSSWNKDYGWRGSGYIDIEKLKNLNIKKKDELKTLEENRETLEIKLETLNEYKNNLKEFYKKIVYVEKITRYVSIALVGVFVCLVLYIFLRSIL